MLVSPTCTHPFPSSMNPLALQNPRGSHSAAPLLHFYPFINIFESCLCLRQPWQLSSSYKVTLFPGSELLKHRYKCRCFQETIASFLPLFVSGISDFFFFFLLRKVMNRTERRPHERKSSEIGPSGWIKIKNEKKKNQWGCMLTIPWIIGRVLA